MKVFIVTKFVEDEEIIVKAFSNEMDADKYIVSNGQRGYTKVIVELE